MPRANIRAGIWTRRVPWAQSNGQFWRTDISTSVLTESWIRGARYILKDGPIVQVPIDDLRRALENAPTRHDGKTVGPYNIDPFAKTVDGTPVQMTFGPFPDLDFDEVAAIHKTEDAPKKPIRPRVETFYTDCAKMLLDRVRSGTVSLDKLVERIQDLNPSVRVHRNRDGSVSLDELAYVVRVNCLRAAAKSIEQELLEQ